MTKQSGLGDNLYLGGVDLSGDTQSLGRIGGGPAALAATGIDKSAMERLPGLRDGSFEWVSFFNKDTLAGAEDGATIPTHDKLAGLPRADVIGMYCRGTSVGSPAAGIVAKQIDYNPTRGDDGSLTFKVEARGAGFGIEWGEQLTAGRDTFAVGTNNGTAVDFGAGSSFGLQAYLQALDWELTNITPTVDVKLQHSSDNGVGDPFADITGAAFTQMSISNTIPFAERIATADDLAIEQYVRAVVTVGGTIVDADVAVMVVRNEVAVVF
jgi:hypothetical protein